MSLLRKLLMKAVTMVIMVVVFGGLFRYAQPYIMKAAGVPEGMPGTGGISQAHFSSEESDLMGTVFKSAVKLFTGQAKRDELAGELSEKLYGGRGDASTMSELGIELVKPGSGSALPQGLAKVGAVAAVTDGGAGNPNSELGAKLRAKQVALSGGSPSDRLSGKFRTDLLDKIWGKAQANPELSLVPVVLFGMVVVYGLRRRRSREDDLLPSTALISMPEESAPINLTHPVHSLDPEDFELLVALCYQRQGYRVTMPAGLSGGRGGDFTLLRKAEKILVQCEKVSLDHNVPVEKISELHEAMCIAGVKRGMYVASCRFTWDARYFAKAKGVTLINARTLDAVISSALENPEENLLDVSQWASKLMKKVKITPPVCPACEASMDQVSSSTGSAWVCSERPECSGRRLARKHLQIARADARSTDQPAEVSNHVDEIKSADGGQPAERVNPMNSSTKQASGAKPVEAVRQTNAVGSVKGVRQPTAIERAHALRLAAKQVEEAARLANAAKQASAAKQADPVQRPTAIERANAMRLAAKQEEAARLASAAKQSAANKQADPVQRPTAIERANAMRLAAKREEAARLANAGK